MASRILMIQVGLGRVGGRVHSNGRGLNWSKGLIRPKERGELITLEIAQEFFKDVANN